MVRLDPFLDERGPRGERATTEYVQHQDLIRRTQALSDSQTMGCYRLDFTIMCLRTPQKNIHNDRPCIALIRKNASPFWVGSWMFPAILTVLKRDYTG